MLENKFVRLLIFGIFLFVTGIIYQNYYRPPSLNPVPESGRVVEIDMRVLENQWSWEPAVITIEPGDRVILNIFNEDTYDHGFALEVFGVNRRLFPKRTTRIEFVASKEGEFAFYCSVPCGDGHYKQTGRFLVTPRGLENSDALQGDTEPGPAPEGN